MKTKDYREGLFKRLQDPEYAVRYLTDTLAEETPESFLMALKDFIDARWEDFPDLVKEVGTTRQEFCQSAPRFSTIFRILKCLDLQFVCVNKKG